jgi:clan AA aspartic protease
MISGIVTPNRQPVIRLRIQGPEGHEEEPESIIDTGFNDFLTLPRSLVSALGLPFAATAEATLADNSVVQLNYHRAQVIWDGEPREVLVLATEGGPLVGMSMLYGYELSLQAKDGGRVVIRRLN